MRDPSAQVGGLQHEPRNSHRAKKREPLEPAGHRARAEKLRQPSMSLQECFLYDVRGITAGCDPCVHPQFDHRTQAAAVAIEQLRRDRVVAGSNAINQLV